MDWRFYTVPGNPQNGFENPAMAMAAKTWGGQWWKLGGGGTVWDAIVYDPVTNLVYFGVGNGTPWNDHYRDPTTKDNLFLASSSRSMSIPASTCGITRKRPRIPGTTMR